MNRTFVAPRRATRKRAGSAELIYLVIVLAAGLGTGFWISQLGGMNLSGIKTVADALGITRVDRHKDVGYVAPTVTASASSVTAPYCAPGETPAFAANVAALAREVGPALGNPLECAHPGSSTGDLVQLTTTGLVAYDNLRDTVSFTDGWRHWAVTPRGLVTWEGPEATPPAG